MFRKPEQIERNEMSELVSSHHSNLNGIQCEQATSEKKQSINNNNKHIYDVTKQNLTNNSSNYEPI